VTVVAVAAAWVAVEQVAAGRRLHRGWADLAILAGAALAPVPYYRWLFGQPNWQLWEKTNLVRSLLAGFLLGLGPLLLLAAAGAWRWRGGIARLRFPIVWSVVGLCLVFSHPLVKFEAKLVEGLIAPLAVLGAGAVFGPRGPSARRGWALAALLLLLLVPSTPFLAAKSLQVVAGRWRNLFPAEWTHGSYLYAGDLAVLRHLAREPLPAGSLLMAPYEEGRLLPAAADVRVFVSTPSFTPEFPRRWRASEEAYAPSLSADERRFLLRRLGATHVWYSPAWGLGFDPAREPWLEPVVTDRGAGVWRIVP
jgi:hypothetical protein